jgi:predicted transcriptional regulator
MEDAAAHRASQAQLYGEPLGVIIEGIGTSLGLTQGRIAKVLGLSAPMLSHLVSGRRVKIGNPMAHTRLLQLRALAADVAAGRLSAEQAETVLPQIAASNDSWTTSHSLSASAGAADAGAGPIATPGDRPATDPAAVVRATQELFRCVADAGDWLAAAAELEGSHPAIAEVLRTYGASRTSTAQEHWHRVLGD